MLATSASTARTPRASRSARPARCSAPSSARSSCSRTSATAAATACPPARSACIDRRERATAACAWKCTLCYDRLKDGHGAGLREGVPDRLDPVRPARRAARARAASASSELHERASPRRALYGDDPDDGVGGVGAFFLLLDEPEVYGLPPDPVVTDPRPARRSGARRCAAAPRSAGRDRWRPRRGEPMSGKPALTAADASGHRSYYGRPVLKAPVWKPEIPLVLLRRRRSRARGRASAGARRLTGNRRWPAPRAAASRSPASASARCC